ncbi:MAG: hypothetical protein NZ874_09900 [Fimbriimonadales bacterium]|nr:hypothetical protein [Fimbriimonadales bacterium]
MKSSPDAQGELGTTASSPSPDDGVDAIVPIRGNFTFEALTSRGFKWRSRRRGRRRHVGRMRSVSVSLTSRVA